MMATALKVKPTRPPQLYVGQPTCDFRPEWEGLTGDGLALAEGCWSTQIGDHLPWLVLADWLDERDDERGQWVRQYVHWEQKAQAGKFSRKQVCEWDDRQKSFAEFTKTESGWRWVGLWNAIAARWCPDGYGVGPQWETWADERVRTVNVWCVMWVCRLTAGSQAYAAGRQAYAAGSQADAAGRQADAAGSQADAAGSQAYAAGRQADAAWRQADAAWSQAYAAWRQADAAWRQAEAAGRQAYAAGSQAYAAWRQADAAGRQADAAWRQAYAAQKRCRKWLLGFWSAMSAGFPFGGE
jgi:uncharacterized protein (TIGR02996 family)